MEFGNEAKGTRLHATAILEMALRFEFGFDAGGFGFALGVFLGDPGSPGLAVGGVAGR